MCLIVNVVCLSRRWWLGVDLAIRQAEPTGAGGEVVFYENDMRVAEEHKYDISSLLKKAIANDDLSVLYQPQIELATNEVVVTRRWCGLARRQISA